jgi:hypothetical protein
MTDNNRVPTNPPEFLDGFDFRDKVAERWNQHLYMRITFLRNGVSIRYGKRFRNGL